MTPLTLGLPIISNLIGKTLKKSENQYVQQVGESLLDIDDSHLSSKHLHEQFLAEMENDREFQKQVNQTYRTELKSRDPYVRRARPTWIYMGAFAFGSQMLGLTALLISTIWIPENAKVFSTIVAELVNLTGLWSVFLGTIGIVAGARTIDKFLGKDS